MKKRVLSFLTSLLITTAVFATHNRSGEITFEQISQYTYRIKIVTYTKVQSQADRPMLEISWGDNTSDSLPRKAAIALPEDPDIRRNEYEGIHTYPGASTYRISFEDPNRNSDVVNIPGSVNVPFYVETLLIIDPFRGGYNNSPVLLQPPIDKGAVNRIFIHNPNAYDPDGDSLSYSLVVCRGKNGANIPGYTFPKANNTFSIDAITGELLWDSPQQTGEYNVAIRIDEWRKTSTGKYANIGYVIRDMQIEIGIKDLNNNPPIISMVQDTCIEANKTLTIEMSASDPDPNDSVRTLTATGGPFSEFPPAEFSFSGNDPAKGTFKWDALCEHIRQQPYQVVFKAIDANRILPLTDLKTLRIRVVPPAVENPRAQVQADRVLLSWDREICPQATGYKIYRKTDSTDFTPANCETGLPAYTGFVLIDEVSGRNTTAYTDDNKGVGLVHGIKYCYRIVASFPEGVESYTSTQVCVELKKDVPVMCQATVDSTSTSTGAVTIRWTKPFVADLDTVQNKGPYAFKVYRTGTAQPLKEFSNPFFAPFSDTTFTDSPATSQNTPSLNTQEQPASYYVEFYTDGTVYKGKSSSASTVFLTLSPSDNRLNLSWAETVPWNNTSYIIHKKNPVTGLFEALDTTAFRQYTDSGLTNGSTYCYYIESRGALSGDGLPDSIVNRSQIACGVPVDNVPPCPPTLLTVEKDCDRFENKLTWNNPNKSCADDVLSYRIYQKKSTGAQWSSAPVDSLAPSSPFGPDQFSFTHDNLTLSIAGCYSITAVDSAGNESARSNVVCVDNCPRYTLPNVFTPNSDGVHDSFTPFDNFRFIEGADIKIFNRWGQLMFSYSGSPDFNWDGRNQANQRECSEGTYYYVCEIREIHLDETTKRTITGFVELLRGKEKSTNIQ